LKSSATPFWRRLLAATLAVLMASSGAAQAQVRLPALGESASEDLTVGAERRVGDQIMAEGRRDPSYYDDPVLLEYVQSLWNPLVAAARQRGDIGAETDGAFAWEIFLMRDRSVNAFALPGGYVGVHLGLIAITTARDQLASVLAHELSHVTQRHIARSIAPQKQASLVALAALVLGVIAASRANNGDMANAAIMGGQAAAIQGQLNFSRDMEREADRIGYGVLAAAGFSTAGMSAMFEKMDVAMRLNDNNSYPYLRSHPLTVDRIAEARNRTLLGQSAPPAPPLEHALMQMRARVLMDDSVQGLQRLRGETSSPELGDQLAALYGGAMAASLLRDHARAEAQAGDALRLAAKATPREPAAERALYLLQAQVRLARGDAQGALAALDALPTGSTTRGPLLLRAQAALDLHRQSGGSRTGAAAVDLRRSTEALQTWLVDQPLDAAAWQLLAGTSEALGLKLRSMRAGAEARAVVGDLSGAIDRLRAAQAAARTPAAQDFIEASVVDARLRQLLTQRRQMVLEARGGRAGPSAPESPNEPVQR
jgi:predicted Zn-dependent protease